MFVGSSRNVLLDRGSPELPLSPVMVQFVKYLKVIVVLEESELPGNSTVTIKRNAFEIMAQSLRKRNLKDKYPKRLKSKTRRTNCTTTCNHTVLCMYF